MIDPAKCQCTKCFRYLTRDRTGGNGMGMTHDEWYRSNRCAECERGGIPLAILRGTLVDPTSLECLALISEECGEVVQRNGKIVRWGWEANFDNSTQRHKLEVELGDVIAATLVAAENEQITLTEVVKNARSKIEKLREDASGPRQRLMHASVPDDHCGRKFGALLIEAFDER